MLSFPNCKINLGLNIIGQRGDGFHNLETIFLPIPLSDVLEIIPSDKTEFTMTGLPINGNDNLCIKAYNLIKRDFAGLPGIKMHLHKVIPVGAGLGGGSADAAFALQLLNEIFKLNLKTEQLLEYALQLGSDGPFFIIDKSCFATGRGEILEPVHIDLTNYKILIVNPGIHIDTKWAFSKIIPQERKVAVKEIVTQPIETWKAQLQNDFEIPVFTEYPAIEKIKSNLYELGAAYASLSGSGSSVYGLFSKEKKVEYKEGKYFQKLISFN